MGEITLRGRTIPLVYTVQEMKQIQEEVARLDRIGYMIFGRNPEDENDASLYGGPEHLSTIAKTVRILGNAGLEEAGEEPDLTEKWILRSLKPHQILDVVAACMETFTAGNESEIPPNEEDGPVDVTLEKINKKKEKES